MRFLFNSCGAYPLLRGGGSDRARLASVFASHIATVDVGHRFALSLQYHFSRWNIRWPCWPNASLWRCRVPSVVGHCFGYSWIPAGSSWIDICVRHNYDERIERSTRSQSLNPQFEHRIRRQKPYLAKLFDSLFNAAIRVNNLVVLELDPADRGKATEGLTVAIEKASWQR